MEYQFSTSCPSESVKELLSRSFKDCSLFRIAYKGVFSKDLVYGKVGGDKLWVIRPYDEEVSTYFCMPPRRIFFAEISEADGTTQIKGKFRFPWAYWIAILLVLAEYFIGFELPASIDIGFFILLLLPALFIALAFLYGYVGNRRGEKRTIAFLNKLFEELENEKIN